MENPHQQYQQEGQFHPRLLQKKSAPLPNALQEECLSGSCPFQARVWECCLGPLPQERHRQARESPEISSLIHHRRLQVQTWGMCNKHAHWPRPAFPRRETTPTETDIPVQGGERARTGYQHRTLFKGSKTQRTNWAKQFEDFVKKNIVEGSICNNTQCFRPITAKSEQYRNSFFVRTAYDWNLLSDNIVNCDSVETFRTLINKRD